MPEESHSFASTRVRLEEIVAQVRKKDTSLEASLDLLEEGVRLANQCTELIDHADWEAGDVVVSDSDGAVADEALASDGAEAQALVDGAAPDDGAEIASDTED